MGMETPSFDIPDDKNAQRYREEAKIRAQEAQTRREDALRRIAEAKMMLASAKKEVPDMTDEDIEDALNRLDDQAAA